MRRLESIVLVTRKTRLAELVERFNTRAQAKFYIEHAGGDFESYVREDEAYQRSLATARVALDVGAKVQILDRTLVPTYLFSGTDVIVTLGQDGLVANVAKYVGGRPIVAVNPDAERFDGVLLPWSPVDLASAIADVTAGQARLRAVTMAEARLQDGQRLMAFNDLFIGASSHVSARYRVRHGGREEDHSSSGVLVATGAGSTGWLSSVFNEVSGLLTFLGGSAIRCEPMAWEDRRLTFVVREPFRSRHSQAGLVAGTVTTEQVLVVESHMPSGGVIFSDGVEQDRLAFNAGATATISVAKEQASLVVP